MYERSKINQHSRNKILPLANVQEFKYEGGITNRISNHLETEGSFGLGAREPLSMHKSLATIRKETGYFVGANTT
jgi:hypothetical protein